MQRRAQSSSSYTGAFFGAGCLAGVARGDPEVTFDGRVLGFFALVGLEIFDTHEPSSFA